MDQCRANGCPRSDVIRRGPNAGWCGGHVQQVRAGRPITPLRHRGSPGVTAVRDEQGRKHCTDCGQWRPEIEFSISRRARDGRHSHCKGCTRARKYAARYGVTTEQVDALGLGQGGVCKICSRPETDDRVLHVDHDHGHCASGCPDCVRGLLCRDCNVGLGLFRDDPALLDAAATYVREHMAA